MGHRPGDEGRALDERRAMREQHRQDREKAVARAVANYLDWTCESIEDAARGQGVPYDVVRVAVQKARGK